MDVKNGTAYLSSGTLFLVATQALQRTSKQVPDREPQQVLDALAAITFAAMAVEAFVNEGPFTLRNAQGAGSLQLRTLAEMLDKCEDQRGTIELKLLLWQSMITGRSLSGERPFQDFAVLLAARNVLVHLKPDVFDMVAEPDGTAHRMVGRDRPLLKRLRDKKVLATVEDLTTASIVVALNTRAMARWACVTARDTVFALVSLIPQGSTVIGGSLSQLPLVWKMPEE